MKTIPLTHGQAALVDDEDFEYLSQWKWHVRKCRHTSYAKRSFWKNGDWRAMKSGSVQMHREIVKAKKGQVVDHINKNGLDNQKKNLRSCTRRENTFNRKVREDTSTGVNGVTKRWGKFYARLGQKHLGYFKTLEEASQIRREAELKNYGKFAPKL